MAEEKEKTTTTTTAPKKEVSKEDKEFDELCKKYEKLEPLTARVILADKASTLIPALNAITEGDTSGVEIFSLFILVTIAADGKLSEGEYEALLPSMRAFFGEDEEIPSYEDCVKRLDSLKKEEAEAKKELNDFVDEIGKFSPAMKEDLIVVALIICSIDHKISAREKAWIKKLIA